MSPVHIGCGDVYEPTGFVIDRDRKKLIAFDPLDFAQSLSDSDRKKFLDICEKGTLESILEIYKFMDGRKSGIEGHEVSVSDGFLKNYTDKLKLQPNTFKRELNNFSIMRTSFAIFDNKPYIPGTAIKGTLRNGWLNYLNKGQKREKDIKNGDLQKLLLGGAFETDPFSQFRLSDLVPVNTPPTHICFGFFKKKNPEFEKDSSPKQLLEIVLPGSDSIFEGLISINQPEPRSAIKAEKALPDIKSFLQKATTFFEREMDKEIANLQKMKISANIKQQFQQTFGDRYLKTVFPLRIGRHSGAECMTIEGARNIKILNAKPPFRASTTTIWLAADDPKATSGLLPFGWVALELLDADMANPMPAREIVAKPSAWFAKHAKAQETPEQIEAKLRAKALEEENRLYPWKAPLRQLDVVTDWGGFKQKVLDNELLTLHKELPEISQRVFELAIELRKKWKASWETGRDELISAWLQPSGLVWPPAENQAADTPNEAAAELERIKAFNGPKAYMEAPADMNCLSSNGLKWLKKQFEAWQFNAKDAKQDRKAEWERLKQHMNK